MLALEVLADPTRRRIVEILSEGERSVQEIASAFDVTQPAISHHLRRLKEAHLVRSRNEAQRHLYQLDPAGLDEVERWVASARRYWQPRLARLDERVRHQAAKGRRAP